MEHGTITGQPISKLRMVKSSNTNEPSWVGKNHLSNFQHTNNMMTHRSASHTITQGRESPHLHTACRSRAGCVRCGSAQILSSMDQCINSPVETNNYIWEEAGGRRCSRWEGGDTFNGILMFDAAIQI